MVKIETLELEIKTQSSKAAESIDKLTSSLSRLKKATNMEAIAKLTHNIVSLNAALNTLDMAHVARLNKLANAMERVAKSSSALKNIKNLEKLATPNEKATSGEAKQPTEKVDVSGAASSYESLRSKLEGIGKGFASAGKHIATFTSGAVKAGVATTKFSASIVRIAWSPFANAVKNATKKLGEFFNRIKRIAMYRLIRSALKAITQGLKEGTNAIYQYSASIGGSFASSMDRMSSQLALMNASIGAAAAPLIQMLEPAIMAVTGAVIKLANALAQVFSLMSGASGWTKATGAVKKYGDAAGGAANQQKKLTAGIDELNVLSADSGSGGGGAGDAAYDFEELGFSDWAKELKALFDAGNFQGAGSLIAEMLNDMVDSFDAYSWGNNLGKKIEQGIEFAYGFLDKINTENIGAKIADALNGLGDAIDFAKLGGSISLAINRVFDLIRGFAQKFNWKELGKDISTGVVSAIKTLDFGNIGATIFSVMHGLYSAVSSFFENTDWSDLGTTIVQKITDLISNLNIGQIIQDGYRIAGNIIGAVLSFAFGALKEIFTNGSILDVFQLLFDAINGAFTGFFIGLGNTMGVDFLGIFENALNSVGEFFVNTWNGIVEIWSTVSTWFNDNVIVPLLDFFTPIYDFVSAIFEGTWLIVQAIWIVASTWFNDAVIQPIITFFAPIVERVSKFFSDLWTKIKVVWMTVANWFNTVVIQPVIKFFEPIVEKIGNIFNSLWEGIKKGVVAAFNFVIDKIELAVNNIIDLVNGVLWAFNKVADMAGDIVGEDWSGVAQISHISVPRLANGGMVSAGDLFVANERGPELIAGQNGRTNVVSNDQIVSSITEGVYNAVASAMGQNKNNENAVYVYLDGKQIEASTRNVRQRRGASIATGGVVNYA